VREFEVRYAVHHDVSIAFTVFGDGQRDLLLGQNVCPVDLLLELPQFASFIDALCGFSRVIAYDPRGQGASDSLDPSTATLEASGDDVIAVLDATDSARATYFSMSGSNASTVLLAATHPNRIRSVILTHPRMSYPEFREMSPERRKLLARALVTTDSLRLANPRVAHDPVLQRWWGRARRLNSSPDQTARNLEVAGLTDLEAMLPGIRVPTLVLHRRDNRLWDIEHSRAFANRIPGARLVELAGSETDLFLGDTSEVLAEVEAFICAEEQPAEVDRPLATVLFTDIVASTDQLSAVGDRAWRHILDEHDDAVASAVAAHRGRVIKKLGDGTLATFDGPARAVRCAQTVRDKLAALGIEVRAGLHTGEIELRSGDVAGIAVHIASRVAALAGAGEILVSRTVVDLTAGSSIAFDPRGEHQLKGVPGHWSIFAVP
jgi:class 3 adenylate cyclase